MAAGGVPAVDDRDPHVGVVGSLIGGTVAWLLGTGSIWELNILGFVLSVVAAVLLVGSAEALTGKDRSRV